MNYGVWSVQLLFVSFKINNLCKSLNILCSIILIIFDQCQGESGPDLLAEEVEEVQTASETEEESEDEPSSDAKDGAQSIEDKVLLINLIKAQHYSVRTLKIF